MDIAGRARKIYTVLMALTGALLALAVNSFPVMANWRVSPIMFLVAVSLLIDVGLLLAASAGKAEPLDMNSRLIGFFAGAAVYIVIGLTLSGGSGIAF